MQKVLFLKGEFVEKIWGGDRLKDFGYEIDSKNVGEYWAISAMKEFPSTIKNGEFKGKKLDDVYKNNKGLFANENEETFPLLVKLIDAKDDLSIQVHPDDKMASELENSRGKTECWYILNEKKSSIIYGLKAKDKEKAIKLIDQRKWDELLNEVEVKKGDFFSVPAGRVHAIKKDSLILEIQQASDITYRLYDYDRKDDEGNLRQLHLEKSKRAIKIEDIKTEKLENLEKTELLSNQYFQVRKYVIKNRNDFKLDKKYLLESVIEGEGNLLVDDKKYPIKKGDFFILTNYCKNYSIEGDLSIVEANVN